MTVLTKDITYTDKITIAAVSASHVHVDYDSVGGHIVFAYWDTTATDTVRVVSATISGEELTLGSPVAGLTQDFLYDFMYEPTSGYFIGIDRDGYLSTFSVSGNVVTFEDNTSIGTGTYYAKLCRTATGFCVYYHDFVSGYSRVIAGTISGGNITLGSYSNDFSNATEYLTCDYDSVNDRILLARNNSSGYIQIRVMKVVGTTITLGSIVGLTTSAGYSTAVGFDATAGKFALWAWEGDNYTTRIITISDVTPSATSPVVVGDATADDFRETRSTFHTTNNSIVSVFETDDVGGSTTWSANPAGLIEFLIDGSNISISNPIAIGTSRAIDPDICYIPGSNLFAVVYQDYYGGNYAVCRLVDVPKSSFWINFKGQTETL